MRSVILTLFSAACLSAQIAIVGTPQTTAGAGANSTATTPGINCTGATAAIVGAAIYNLGSVTSANLTISDSHGNSYSAHSIPDAGSGIPHVGIFISTGGTYDNGSGSGMTFSAQCTNANCGTSGYASISASCWSGLAIPIVVRSNKQASVTGSSLATGNITTASTDLVVTFLATDGTAPTAPSGYTTLGTPIALVAGDNIGLGGAYKLSPSNPENPTWTESSSDMAATGASLEVASSGSNSLTPAHASTF